MCNNTFHNDAHLYRIICRFGIFSFGYYTMGLELNVEATYPVDQVMGTAMIFASGQIHGAIFILISSALEKPLTTEAKLIQVQTRQTL